ncbi:MAG: hypothetical protein LBG52_08000 [Candidatus Peribacteria bacterium]|jgi:hypothetical protein|nr:hypothetical protein [Candidatus Peribacteria bacterium]
MTPYYAPFVIARYTKTTDGENYYVGRILNNSEITITKTLGGILYNDNTA